jgi:hypothetical protein
MRAHPLYLNSAATAPVTLLPIGSPALLTSTQALSSNRTLDPSARRSSLAARTTTAWRTSPRRTLLAALAAALDADADEPPDSGIVERCFWTTTTMRSPVRGVRVSWEEILREEGRGRTDAGGALALEEVDAFDDGGTGVVDAVEHRLGRLGWQY